MNQTVPNTEIMPTERIHVFEVCIGFSCTLLIENLKHYLLI